MKYHAWLFTSSSFVFIVISCASGGIFHSLDILVWLTFSFCHSWLRGMISLNFFSLFSSNYSFSFRWFLFFSLFIFWFLFMFLTYSCASVFLPVNISYISFYFHIVINFLPCFWPSYSGPFSITTDWLTPLWSQASGFSILDSVQLAVSETFLCLTLTFCIL